MFTYDPQLQELSPNVDAEVELSFHTGDVITVYGEMDDDGFYMAELRGHRGLVPSNFLTDAPNAGKGLLGTGMPGMLPAGMIPGQQLLPGQINPQVPARGAMQGKKGEPSTL